jgi:3-oxoacyl-[acyl-carrier-protein] synthase-1
VGETVQAILERRSGLRPCDFENAKIEAYIGRVEGVEELEIGGLLTQFDCRNNRLALLGLQQDGFRHSVGEARKRHGAKRIAVIMGTSTSGILEVEHAYQNRDPSTGMLPSSFYTRAQFTHCTFSVADFVRRLLKLEGPAMVISTACSSSAKVFACASRLMESGICEAAVVGGVDSLCLNTLYGFFSLDLVSPNPCRPCDVDRDGLTLGEGSGFVLLEKVDDNTPLGSIILKGYGESCDGYHMSHPHPAGEGAIIAMRQALNRAKARPEEVGYIKLHGTATKTNDSIEDRAISTIFGSSPPCSSIKGWIGHNLGAAGAIETVILALCLKHSLLPGTLNTTAVDPTFKCQVLLQHRRESVKLAMGNYFGFGGNNCSLLLGTN